VKRSEFIPFSSARAGATALRPPSQAARIACARRTFHLAHAVALGNLRHRRVIGFAQDVNHLLFSKPRLLDASLAYRKRFSQVLAEPTFARQVSRRAAFFNNEPLGRVFRMSRSGFYGWCARPLSPRARELLRPEVKIGVLHRASRRTYCSLPISLRDAGEVGGRHRAARLMR
jgi:hypothetical protein